MNSIVDKPILEKYNEAYDVSANFKRIIVEGTDEHLDYISELRPYHDSFIESLENFSRTFSRNFPSKEGDKKIMLDKIKELMNLVEYTRQMYNENDLAKKSFPQFIDKLFIQSNDLLEFITDLSIDDSIWVDDDLIF